MHTERLKSHVSQTELNIIILPPAYLYKYSTITALKNNMSIKQISKIKKGYLMTPEEFARRSRRPHIVF